MSYKRTTYYT